MSWLGTGDLDFATMAAKALTEPTTRSFLHVGGGCVALGLVLGTAKEIYEQLTGGSPNFITPIARAVVFTALLASYSAVSSGIVGTVSLFGSVSTATGQVERAFYARFLAFEQHEAKASSDDSFLSGLSATSLKLSLTQFLVKLSYAFTFSVVYVLKHIQSFMLSVAIAYGPILLGFAAISTFFNVLALSWFWALVEISAWGITMQILLGVMGRTNVAVVNGSPQLFQEMVQNVVYASLLLAVPAITSMMIRSQPASMAGQRAVSMASAGVFLAKSALVAPVAALGAKGTQKLGSYAWGKVSQARAAAADKKQGQSDVAKSRARHFAIAANVKRRADGGGKH